MIETMIETKSGDEFAPFKSSMQSSFINTMQKDLSPEIVCRILGVPVTAMRVFIKALNPKFVWEDLCKNYKSIILKLLNDRSNRLDSRPTRKLLELVGDKSKLQIDG